MSFESFKLYFVYIIDVFIIDIIVFLKFDGKFNNFCAFL